MIFFEMHSCFLENVTECNVVFVEKIWRGDKIFTFAAEALCNEA